MILHLVRHPRPQVRAGVCYGRLDIPAKNARAAATALRNHLPPGLPVWSSPLRRCRALARHLHPAPRLDPRLAEMHFGAWEGQPWDAIPRTELDAWAADLLDYAPPGGESPRQLQARALDFVAGLHGLALPEAVLVTHAGVIRSLIAAQHQLPPAGWLTLDLPYGSHTLLVIDRPCPMPAP